MLNGRGQYILHNVCKVTLAECGMRKAKVAVVETLASW